MSNGSYRSYLDFIEEKQNNLSYFGHLLILTLLFLTIFASFFSAYFAYQYKLEEPKREQFAYLDRSRQGLLSTSASLGEIVTIFSVQGEKVTQIESLKDDNDQKTGYLIYMSQLQKNKAKIESSLQNIKFHKASLAYGTPPNLVSINNDLQNYFEMSEKALEKLLKDHQFYIEMHIALGPSLYVPSLLNESVWQTQNIEQILNYYSKMKSEATHAYGNLSLLQSDPDYKPYIDAELKYLETLVNLANAVNESFESSKATVNESEKIENAYSLTVDSRNSLSQTAEQILVQKKYLVDPEKSLSLLVPARFLENSVKNNIYQTINDLNYTNSLSDKVNTFTNKVETLIKL